MAKITPNYESFVKVRIPQKTQGVAYHTQRWSGTHIFIIAVIFDILLIIYIFLDEAEYSKNDRATT